MTKFFIPIYKTSIRKNPEAGRHEYQIPGNATVNLKGVLVGTDFDPADQPREMVDAGYYVTSMRLDPGKRLADVEIVASKVPHALNGPEPLKRLNKWFARFGIAITHVDINRDVQTVRAYRPEEDYLYEYIPVKVTCWKCRESFKHTELESDNKGYDDDAVTYTMCPKCGTWDCCELEYESITNLDCEKIIKQYGQN